MPGPANGLYQKLNGRQKGEPNPRKGKPNRRTSTIAQDLRAALRNKLPDYSPLLRLAQVAEDDKQPIEIRVQCHGLLLPYLCSRTTPAPLDPQATIAFEADLAKARAGAVGGEIQGLAERMERARQRMDPFIRQQVETGTLRELPMRAFEEVDQPAAPPRDIPPEPPVREELDTRGNIVRYGHVPPEPVPEPPRPRLQFPALTDESRRAVRRAALAAANVYSPPGDDEEEDA